MTQSAIAPLQRAPAKAQLATRRCAENRSGALLKALVSAPATNPIWTDIVNQDWRLPLSFHAAVS